MEIKTLASGSGGNCYHIADGETRLLIECGIPVAKIKKGLNFQLSKVSGCLISHSHKDHSGSAKNITDSGIDILATKETLSSCGIKRGKEIKPLATYEVGSFLILPFETQHDCVGSVGFLIKSRITKEKLLFATDTFYIKYKFKNLTHIMIECNYIETILKENLEKGIVNYSQAKRLLESHMSLENLKGFLSANDLHLVEEIHLLHLSKKNSNSKKMKKEIEELTGKITIIYGG